MVANTQNDDGNDTIHPLFYHTTIFLLITTVLQILSSYQLETAGPIDWFASLLIPQIASWGFMAGGFPLGVGASVGEVVLLVGEGVLLGEAVLGLGVTGEGVIGVGVPQLSGNDSSPRHS